MSSRIVKACRNLLFPLFLGAVYSLQIQYPVLFRQGAIWSDHPHWWQFVTNGFLSGNYIHLILNMCGIWVVCSQFASQVRLYFLFLWFIVFSTASSFFYYRFFMPAHATLVGASGGIYALMGIFCWFQRHDRVYLCGLRKLSVSFLPAMLTLLVVEGVVATFWIHILAWQVHLIAFFLSMVTAIIAHAVYTLHHRLADQGRYFQQSLSILQKMRACISYSTPEPGI